MIELKGDFLQGSYPPVVTPFRDGKVDYDAYARLIEFQVKEGTHGVLVNGTSAEPSTLTIAERNQLVEVAVQAAAKRIPVAAATGSQSHAETIALSEFADKAGADALVIVTPYYVRAPQRGVAEYYIDLGRRTKLPFLMYHIPGRTAFTVELATLERIAEQHEHFVGIKHAQNDLSLATQMLQRFGPEFRVFAGLEELTFPLMAIGARGTMNAVANIVPGRIAALANATLAGKMASARKLHMELLDLNLSVFYDTNPIAVKYMMKRLRILERNEHRLPMAPATPELEKRLDGVLRRAGLLA